MKVFYLTSVFVHILAAIVWIGGMFFLALVAVPVIKKPALNKISAVLFQQTGIRFRIVGWICLILFLITGLFNLFYRLQDWQALVSARFWNGVFGETLLIKLILFAIILVMSLIHDFYIGPKATAAWQEDPNSREARKLRKNASWFGRINLILGVAAVYLAIGMIRGWP